MTKKLTLSKRQTEILNFIKSYLAKNQVPPTIREIAKAVHLSSISTVHAHLNAMDEKGFIKRDKAKPRYIELLQEVQQERVLCLPVLAGLEWKTPEESEYKIAFQEFPLPLPLSLAREPENFVFRFNGGESMKEVGIYEGDLLVIEKTEEAQDRDLILALAEKKFLVRRYFKASGGMVKLEPENHRMRAVFVKNLEILGKVIGVIRSLGAA